MEQSLRANLKVLEAMEQLHCVDREVDPEYELGAVLSKRGHESAQYFHNVSGYDMPVVGNLFNSRAKVAAGLGLPKAELQPTILSALKKGIEPEIVHCGPVQEVVHTENIDIGKLLPVPTWFEKESGPYITAGVIIAKDPLTGKRNVSIARFRVEGGNLLMAGIAPSHHLGELMRRAQQVGKPLELAVSIGNHIAVLLASQMYVELGHDEYDVAGALLGEPLRVVPCKTVDLEVPAEAEIVIEGTLHPDQTIDEGPVSEFPGFYVYYGPGQSFKVSAVTHREDAIYQAILPGFAPEHLLLGGEAIGATTCMALQKVIPAVQQVLITEGGMGRVHAVITMHKPKAGEGKRAIMLAMGITNLLKLVTVVDDDIDPEDPVQVEWALASRMRGDEDIMIIPGCKGDRCDAQVRDLTVTKVGMVATSRPGDDSPGGNFEYARPPHEVMDKVERELEQY
jgi:UbiD family decarboxylase